jgi:hypothetical protein
MTTISGISIQDSQLQIHYKGGSPAPAPGPAPSGTCGPYNCISCSDKPSCEGNKWDSTISCIWNNNKCYPASNCKDCILRDSSNPEIIDDSGWEKLVKDFMADRSTIRQKTWAELNTVYFGGDKNYMSPLDIAKFWILGTDGLLPKGSGCDSCMAGVAVSLQEGGNQAAPASVSPSRDVPCSITDPTFSSSSHFCPDTHCTSGSYWQVSSAFIPSKSNGTCTSDTNCPADNFCTKTKWQDSGLCYKKCTSSSDCPDKNYCSTILEDKKTCFSCPVCEDPTVNCNTLDNPFCAASVAYRFTSQPNQFCPPGGNMGDQCTVKEMATGIDPGCFFGVFPLYSCGWNSAACKQMYRQTTANEALPYCRLSIQACELAKKDLESYGWNVPCDVSSSDLSKVVQTACKNYDKPGDWATPKPLNTPPTPCKCGTKDCGT